MFVLLVVAVGGFRLLRNCDSELPLPRENQTPTSIHQLSIGYEENANVPATGPTTSGSGDADRTVFTVPGGQFRGITLALHSSYPKNPYERYIDEIAATGANTVNLVVTAYQENASSTSLFVEARKIPAEGRIRKLINYAHSKSLRVAVMPILLLENPEKGEWRGKISPTDWNSWWDRYSDYILHYAKLAQSENAELFILGSELVSTESQTGRWSKLIGKARENYKGLLTYSANWDHYDAAEWWKDLDIISMTTYHDMETPKHPTVEQLVEAWKPIKERAVAWRERMGLPLMFTEVGWPNQVTCANEPWNYYAAIDEPDPEAQANCFEAFFRTWLDEPYVAGVLIWEWRNHPGMAGGPEDTSYIPCEKPAEKIIEKYFKRPLRFISNKRSR